MIHLLLRQTDKADGVWVGSDGVSVSSGFATRVHISCIGTWRNNMNSNCRLCFCFALLKPLDPHKCDESKSKRKFTDSVSVTVPNSRLHCCNARLSALSKFRI